MTQQSRPRCCARMGGSPAPGGGKRVRAASGERCALPQPGCIPAPPGRRHWMGSRRSPIADAPGMGRSVRAGVSCRRGWGARQPRPGVRWEGAALFRADLSVRGAPAAVLRWPRPLLPASQPGPAALSERLSPAGCSPGADGHRLGSPRFPLARQVAAFPGTVCNSLCIRREQGRV